MMTGLFDYSPSEELEPIWITDNFVTLFGDEVDPPDRSDVLSLRLLKHSLFGTGGHPATRAAIWKLLTIPDYKGNKIHREPVPGPFLELGASTGLLALVAAMSGTEEVYHASDSMESSALVEDNGVINGLEILVESNGMAFDPPERFEFYGTIACQTGGSFTNLKHVPLVFYAMKPGGWLLWSGHSAKRQPEIRGQITEFFDLVFVDDCMGWPVMIFKKNL